MPPVLEQLQRWFAGVASGAPAWERRRSPREPAHGRVTVTAGPGCLYHASARDQSARGLGAIVCGDLTVGETVLVRLAERKIRCVVRNRSAYRYGFEFLD